MADFCYSCYDELYGPFSGDRSNDLAGLCPEDQLTLQICESCGPAWFDHMGRRHRDLTDNELRLFCGGIFHPDNGSHTDNGSQTDSAESGQAL